MQLRALPPDECSWSSQRLSLRLDDELSQLERVRLDAHLDACEDCRSLAAELDGLTQLLRGAALEAPETAFVPPRRRALSAYAFRSASGVAAAVVFLVSGLVGLSGLVRPALEPARVSHAELRTARRELAVKNQLLTRLESTRWQPTPIRRGVAAAKETFVPGSPSGIAGSPTFSTGQSRNRDGR